MRRFGFVLFSVVVLMTACSPARKSEFALAWDTYAARFYDQGRIIDTGNNNVSHSEGQGYGMLFAVAADDKARFDELWQWTATTLQRADKLFSWRYTPCPQQDRTCVDDPNNASDGDLLIAWALIKAADKWQEPVYRKSAMAILEAVRATMVVAKHPYVLLLPGENGFIYPNGDVQVNLSYWVFPALNAAADATGDETWDDLAVSGISLIQQSNNQWALTPDWLRVTDDGISLDGVVNPEFGFNACRIPLQLSWQNIDKQVAKPFLDYWADPAAPATKNLLTGAVAEYPLTPGMKAASAATAQLYDEPVKGDNAAGVFTLNGELDYYSASLIMLSRLAIQEGNRHGS